MKDNNTPCFILIVVIVIMFIGEYNRRDEHKEMVELQKETMELIESQHRFSNSHMGGMFRNWVVNNKYNPTTKP